MTNRDRQASHRKNLVAKGFKQTTLWFHAATLDRIYALAQQRSESSQYERIASVLTAAVDALKRVTSDVTSNVTSNEKSVTSDVTSDSGIVTSNVTCNELSVTSNVTDDGLPSRQAAAMLGYRYPSALDNAIRKAGFQVGFVKQGMPGSGRRAVFLGKIAGSQGGPVRSLWRVESD